MEMEGFGPQDDATARRLLFDEAIDEARDSCDPVTDFEGFRRELWRRLAGAYGWPVESHPDSVLARVVADRPQR